MCEHNMQLNLSPSQHHDSIVAQTVPLLRYDGGDLKKWQTKLRRRLFRIVGDMPRQRCPLNVRTIWRREHRLGSIEKIVFTSEPYADVVAYVCLPKSVRPPYAFMICLQGHTSGMHNSIAVSSEDESTPIEVDGDRDFAIGCMARGIAALCIEQRQFGQRRELKKVRLGPHGCYDGTMQALMLGRTVIGERVYDVERGIDYLATREDVDMAGIGIMGNSGGGTISMFAAALLPRIAFAMPSGCFCTFRDSIMSVTYCACNYLPGLLKYAEMSDVMGLFAPKPVVIVIGKDDHIFPLEATKEAFSDLRRIYSAFGAAERCHLVVGGAGHRFYADDAWPVMMKEIQMLRSNSS